MTQVLGIGEMDMARARRKLKRRLAAALITAMAETDADYEFIARRLRDKPEKIERWIAGLITGETKALDEVSDLALALHVELVFSLQRYQRPELPKDEVAPEQPVATAA